MKKSLLALAVLGAFAGMASAQSSVTIYGIVDANLGKDIGNENRRMGQGAQSRLGFRGTEDLGGGLSAYFLFEHRFKPADGDVVNPASFWQGTSIVGMRGGFGSVSLGRTYTTAFLASQLRADPWGWDTVANNGLATGGGIAAVRNASSVTYNFAASGFTFGAQISDGDANPVTIGGVSTAGEDHAWNIGVGYAAGPLTAGFGYEKRSVDKTNWMTLNGAYDLGMVKLGALIGDGELAGQDRESFLVTATAPIAGGELRASYGQLKIADVKYSKQAGIGYFYPLSKRTTVYANFAHDNGTRTDASDEESGYDFGIKHTF